VWGELRQLLRGVPIMPERFSASFWATKRYSSGAL
jgi:hypothetical protein